MESKYGLLVFFSLCLVVWAMAAGAILWQGDKDPNGLNLSAEEITRDVEPISDRVGGNASSDCGEPSVTGVYSTPERVDSYDGSFSASKEDEPPNERGFWAISTKVGQKTDGCIPVYSIQPENRLEMNERMNERIRRQVSNFSGGLTLPEFTEEYDETGISFEHDALHTTTYTSMAGAMYFHYHGVATADVDGNGYQDLYFVNQAGPNELWLNEGDLTFENATEKGGVGVPGQVSSSASFADINNDGRPDLYVTTLGGRNRLFENLGNGEFKDVSTDSGTDYEGYSSSSVIFDHDGDGLLDIYVVNLADFTSNFQGPDGYPVVSESAFTMYDGWTEGSVLYTNQGEGVFEREESSAERSVEWDKEASLVPEMGSPPGLYVANMDGEDALYENEGGDLVDVTDGQLGRTPYGSFDVTVLDVENDGMFDVYVTDKHSRIMVNSTWEIPDMEEQRSEISEEDVENAHMSPDSDMDIMEDGLSYGSSLYRKKETGYEEVSQGKGAQTELPWGPVVGDVNTDGYQDIFVSSGMEFRWYVPDALLLNNESGTFERAEFVTGAYPRTSRYTTWNTVNCSDPWSGRIEDLCSDGRGNGVSGTVNVKNHKSSRGAVTVDLDNDGDLDIVATQFNDRPRVLVNDVAESTGRGYLKVELEGTESPPDGTGAVVSLTTSRETYHRFVQGKSYHAQNRKPLYFGLGPDESPEYVEVHWPTGGKDRYEIEERDTLVTLKQK